MSLWVAAACTSHLGTLRQGYTACRAAQGCWEVIWTPITWPRRAFTACRTGVNLVPSGAAQA